MAAFVFILCVLTALGCCWLLFRAYQQTGTRLLFWSALCFAGLTLNAALVFVDLIVIPDVSLILVRSAIKLASLMVLVVGLIWETTSERAAHHRKGRTST